MNLFKTLVLLLFLPLITKAKESPIKDSITLNGFSKDNLEVGTIDCFIDTTATYTFQTIKQQNFKISFSDFKKQIHAHPFHRNFWLRFSIQNMQNEKLNLRFLIGNADYINLYFISPHVSLKQCSAGNLRSINRNVVSFEDQVSSVLPLSLSPFQKGEVYFEIQQKTQDYYIQKPEIISAKIIHQNVANYFYNDRFQSLFLMFFLGYVFCQILYVSINWFLLRKVEYGYYLFYLLFLFFYFFSRNEVFTGTDLFFSHYPIIAIYLDKGLLLLPYFFYYRFVRYFLAIPANFPNLNKWMKIVEYIILGYFVFDLLFVILTLKLNLQLDLFVLFISFVFIVTTIFIAYLFHKKHPYIYFVLIGSAFVAIGNLLGLLQTVFLQDLNIYFGFDNSLIYAEFGVIIEILFFTLGLNYKMQQSDKEKIKSQQELIVSLKENEALQIRIQNIRNKIARDLHDDIGATLSTILLYSKSIKHSAKKVLLADLKIVIEKIGDSATQIIEEMNDIVWAVNPKNDKLNKIFSKMFLFASPLLIANHIRFNFSVDEDLNEELILMDRRKNFYLIFKEAINNALKYSKCSLIEVAIVRKENSLEMRINDNGKGFDTLNHSIGNGLKNMEQRAKEMNGTFRIISFEGEMTAIILQFPIKNELNSLYE